MGADEQDDSETAMFISEVVESIARREEPLLPGSADSKAGSLDSFEQEFFKEVDSSSMHAPRTYESRVCRELQELLDSNRRYRKNRLFRSRELRPDSVYYVRWALGLDNMSPENKLKMVKKAISENYFRGFDVQPLMQALDRFCIDNNIDSLVYGT